MSMCNEDCPFFVFCCCIRERCEFFHDGKCVVEEGESDFTLTSYERSKLHRKPLEIDYSR